MPVGHFAIPLLGACFTLRLLDITNLHHSDRSQKHPREKLNLTFFSGSNEFWIIG
jgi:hypothetical protein